MFNESAAVNRFTDQFQREPTEGLVDRLRLTDEELLPEARAAIENELRSRGETVPAREQAPPSEPDEEPKRSQLAKNAILIIGALVAVAIAKALANTAVGYVITALLAVYWAGRWLRWWK